MNNNELTHYGVLGMRWGHKKAQSSNASGSSKRRSSKSEDYLRAKKLKKKRLSQLSNAELKELNNRMQLESQYKNLKKQDISAGRKFVKDVGYETAKGITSEYAKKYAKIGIKYIADAAKNK